MDQRRKRRHGSLGNRNSQVGPSHVGPPSLGSGTAATQQYTWQCDVGRQDALSIYSREPPQKSARHDLHNAHDEENRANKVRRLETQSTGVTASRASARTRDELSTNPSGLDSVNHARLNLPIRSRNAAATSTPISAATAPLRTGTPRTPRDSNTAATTGLGLPIFSGDAAFLDQPTPSQSQSQSYEPSSNARSDLTLDTQWKSDDTMPEDIDDLLEDFFIEEARCASYVDECEELDDCFIQEYGINDDKSHRQPNRKPPIVPKQNPEAFVPKSCWVPSTLIALDPSKTFLHTEELLRAKAEVYEQQPDVAFDWFARVIHTTRENFAHTQYFQFRDLFKESGPYLSGALQG